jgi:hypothetical protein
MKCLVGRWHMGGTNTGGTSRATKPAETLSPVRTTMHFRSLLVASCVVLAACGGTVETSQQGSEGGGAEQAGTGGTAGKGGSGGIGPGGSSGTGGTAATGGMAGTGGAIIDGGQDVPPDASCLRTADRLDLTLAMDGGKTIGCSSYPGGIGSVTFQGSVDSVKYGPDSIEINVNTCSPFANCISINQISVKAPGMYGYLPQGAFVTVEAEAVDASGWGCMQRVQITNLPEWEGMKNPMGNSMGIYLAGADGLVDAFGSAPFKVDKVFLGCPVDGGSPCSTEPMGEYALQFSSKTASPGDQAPTVFMGPSGGYLQFQHDGVYEALWVRNLRSYVSGWCDDYWNWSWVMTPMMYE